MKRWLQWLGMALAMAGTAAFVHYVLSSLSIEDLRAHLSAGTVTAGVLAILLYSLTVPVSAFAWQRLLANFGCR